MTRKEYDANRYQKNKEEVKAAVALYARSNREKLNAAKRLWHAEDPNRKRKVHLKYRYKLSLDGYERMLSEQGGVCAVCKRPPEFGRVLSVDHDHGCCPVKKKACGKCNRGLLCHGCNQALGLFREDSTALRNAVEYIEKWRTVRGKIME